MIRVELYILIYLLADLFRLLTHLLLFLEFMDFRMR